MKRIVIILFLMAAINCNAYAAIWVYSSNGTYITKADLKTAALAADAAGKTVIVNSALSAVQSNISSAALHAWPTDRVLKVEKGGSIGNTTKFAFADGNTLSAGLYQIFTGTGSITGLKESWGEWWGAGNNIDSNAALQKAADSLTSGGVLRGAASSMRLKEL